MFLDYTLFDFADEDQLLIVAERFSLSEWILISDELTPQFVRRVVYSSHQFSLVFKDGPMSEIREALQAVNRHTRYLSQRALETIITQQQEPWVRLPRRLLPNASQASTPSRPTARISSVSWASTPPTKQ